jgi:hypothetical protein
VLHQEWGHETTGPENDNFAHVSDPSSRERRGVKAFRPCLANHTNASSITHRATVA